MIRHFTIALLFLVGQQLKLHGQSENFSIPGCVKDIESKMPLYKAEIYVCVGDSVVSSVLCKNGKYSFSFQYGFEYEICFSALGYFKMIVIYDLRSIPSDGAAIGFETNLEVSLSKEIEGFSPEILEVPTAKWTYNPETKDFFFHRQYQIERQALFNAEMERLKQNKR
jgi:hypothetical protein